MKKEFIGKQAKVLYNAKVFQGIIINETKNTITMETTKNLVKIIKKNAIININGKTIQGKDITKRPEERIKK
jgi:RNase P/RNase MRP subunit p29